MNNGHAKNPQLFVDNEAYHWDAAAITGTQIRSLASVPDTVEIYQHVPGHPDKQIFNETIVDLSAHHGPERFSTQAPGSQAG